MVGNGVGVRILVGVGVGVGEMQSNLWTRLLPESKTNIFLRDVGLSHKLKATPLGSLNCPSAFPADPNLPRNSPFGLNI